MNFNFNYPFRLDARNHTVLTSQENHIRDLIEQVLFTLPGERVNRPDLGTGLLALAFLPNSEPLAAYTQAAVQGSLTLTLGSLIAVQDVTVVASDATLQITVLYTILETHQAAQATFETSVG